MLKQNSLFKAPCQFVAGAASIESLPIISHPEIAFIGRSNVGKSSLINALINQKSLAKTSQNPGATKQLNFFLLGEKIMLVDMPGYGFAKVSKSQKIQWDALIQSYLCGRPNLKRTMLLIDARRGIMKIDDEFMEILDNSAINFQIILTKSDAIKPSELAIIQENSRKIAGKHVAAHPEIIITSALTKEGIQDLQDAIAPFAGNL